MLCAKCNEWYDEPSSRYCLKCREEVEEVDHMPPPSQEEEQVPGATTLDEGQAIKSWHFLKEENRVGPVSDDTIRRFIAGGEIDPNDLVWRPGMPEWTPAGQIEGLFLPPPLPSPADPAVSQNRLDPPPIPGGPGNASIERDDGPARAREATSLTVHPWRRWFARLTDLLLFSLVFGGVLGMVSPTSAIWESDFVIGLLMALAWIPIEALLISSFGATPGKALLGISVSKKDGNPLDLGGSFSRAIKVWFFGLGVAIPIVTLFTMAAAFRSLKKEGMTRWDKEGGTEVAHKNVSPAAIAFLTLLWIGLLWVMAIAYAG